MIIKRKSVEICTYSLNEPNIIVTYNLVKEGLVNNIQFWVEEVEEDNLKILNKIFKFINSLPNENLVDEKEIFRIYQNIFEPGVSVFQNYKIKIQEFTTKQMAKKILPKRDFIPITKKNINEILNNSVRRNDIVR